MRSRAAALSAALAVCAVSPGTAPGHPEYLFVASANTGAVYRVSLDDPSCPTDLFADADDGVMNPVALAFNPSPADPGTDELFVAGGGAGTVVRILIDRLTGDKVGASTFGAHPALRSIAFQPGTGRLFAGALNRIYRFAEDGAGFETVFDGNLPPVYPLQDECCIAFHPETGELYAATGLYYDEIMVFSWDGSRLAQSRNLTAYKTGDWFQPQNLLFVRASEGWELLAAAHRLPSSTHSFLRFDPVADLFLGEHCTNALSYLWNFTKSGATGDYYSGLVLSPPAQVRRIAPDFGAVAVLPVPLPSNVGKTTVIAWPPDLDSDGVPDGVEAACGTLPDAPDSDNDGITDLGELSYGGAPDSYDPSGDTDPNSADSDGDGFSDLLETRCGSDPLSGTTPDRIAVSFQPSATAPPAGFAGASGGAPDGRGFGWPP